VSNTLVVFATFQQLYRTKIEQYLSHFKKYTKAEHKQFKYGQRRTVGIR
jgi:hypothetical protein